MRDTGYFVKLAIHLVCFKYDTIFSNYLLKIGQILIQPELMTIHLAYIMLFSYFCVACENSEFCYYIFSHNSFDFSREDNSMCKSYAVY